ncbi:hypothetical protein L3Y34_012968 [Caenorhabditis briggsae]|uniref:Uncharacterized protein n=1 Tax=Caenorhabditis briggsae TaxID=6238 RepID=A0AAE9CX35_CAEBR|nr:hypothetical protein L3Y34_012968 [Caenorhabditis briggsae]
MDNPTPSMSQPPSGSTSQLMTQIQQLEQMQKALEMCQNTGKTLMDDVQKQISITKLSDNVEKLNGEMSTVSSDVNSINTRTGSMESMLAQLLENSNNILKNQSSLEETVAK